MAQDNRRGPDSSLKRLQIFILTRFFFLIHMSIPLTTYMSTVLSSAEYILYTTRYSNLTVESASADETDTSSNVSLLYI